MRKAIPLLIAALSAFLLSGCAPLRWIGTATFVFWEEITEEITNHWGKILIGIFVLFLLYKFGVAGHRQEKREKGEKLGLHRVKPPKELSVEAPLTSGEIGGAIPTLNSAVLTVKPMHGLAPTHGSGFIIAEGGWALTNHHVVGDEEYVDLKPFGSKDHFSGRVIKMDQKRDVALVKLDSKFTGGMLPINQSIPKVGDDVYAFGTPLDESLEGTLTRGVVSAIRKNEELEMIQSDVTIQPGNSGGPLLDKHGNVVGISVAGMQAGGAMTGINYFIPIKDALDKLGISVNIAGSIDELM